MSTEATVDPSHGGERPDGAEQPITNYRSIDSAPAGYSIDRPPSAVNSFLATFIGLSVIGMLSLTILVNSGRLGETRDIVLAAEATEHASIPVRMFVAAFMLSFALNIVSNAWRKLFIAAELIAGLIVISAIVDAIALSIDKAFDILIPIVGQQIISSLIAMTVFPLVVLRNAHLPPTIVQPTGGRIRPQAWAVLIVALTIAFVIAAEVLVRWHVLVDWMRETALLGGLGPGIFLVQQLFAIMASLVGVRILVRSRRVGFVAPVAVLIPAHNEAFGITATIAAVDRAAAAYSAPVRLCVVDNLSSDDTIAVATAAIARCTALTGTVLECREPGKAFALNHGLSQIDEAFVVRIDADTVVGEHCLARAMRHFHNPAVGAVGGLPQPTTRANFWDRARLVETLVRHGFFQLTMFGYDGVVGVPGMFVAYRKAALDAAGPIVQGMNGEDTDICIRMDSAGYRSLVEPHAVYLSETPRTWGHMLEQRTRWFRSGYHIAGRNRRAMFRWKSMAGSLVMPLQLFNSARRAMLAPAIIFATLMITVFHTTFPHFVWQPLVATVVGMAFLVAGGVCLAYGERRALLYLPQYLAFRVIRSYFTIAAVLSLVYLPIYPLRRRSDV